MRNVKYNQILPCNDAYTHRHPFYSDEMIIQDSKSMEEKCDGDKVMKAGEEEKENEKY